MKRKTPFITALRETMTREKGYSFDPDDYGGETYMGISRVYWPKWPGWKVIDDAAGKGVQLSREKELSQMVKDFYRENFWNQFRGDDLAKISLPVAKEVFDTAVNQSVYTASKYLQESINLLNINEAIFPDIIEDGIIGKNTLRTVTLYFDRQPLSFSDKEKMLLNLMNTFQGMHYIKQMRKHPGQEKYRGWFLRL